MKSKIDKNKALMYCDELNELYREIESDLEKVDKSIIYMEENVWNGGKRSKNKYKELRGTVQDSKEMLLKLNSISKHIRNNI